MSEAHIELDRPRLHVDFNELVEKDLVLLSAQDSKIDSSGATFTMREGAQAFVYSDDNLDEDGRIDPLIADGVIERASSTHDDKLPDRVLWRCRIDARGIRLMSEECDS